MAKTVRIDLKGIKRLIKDYPAFNRSVMSEIAKKAPVKIINNIKRKQLEGIYEKGVLKRNAPSTIKKKLAAGKGGKSLIDTGFMTRNTNYFAITAITNGIKIGMANKARPGSKTPYDKIAFYLSQKNYNFLQVPRGYVPPWMMTIIRKRVKTFVKKYS